MERHKPKYELLIRKEGEDIGKILITPAMIEHGKTSFPALLKMLEKIII